MWSVLNYYVCIALSFSKLSIMYSQFSMAYFILSQLTPYFYHLPLLCYLFLLVSPFKFQLFNWVNFLEVFLHNNTGHTCQQALLILGTSYSRVPSHLPFLVQKLMVVFSVRLTVLTHTHTHTQPPLSLLQNVCIVTLIICKMRLFPFSVYFSFICQLFV